MAISFQRMGGPAGIMAALCFGVSLAACSGLNPFGASAPEPQAAPPAAPPPALSEVPPVDLTGKWRLSAAGGRACAMTFGTAPGGSASQGAGQTTSQGTIAPEGGCPGNFFMSRKWSYEHNQLVIRDHKGEPLAQLSFAGGQFEGQGTGGEALMLAR